MQSIYITGIRAIGFARSGEKEEELEELEELTRVGHTTCELDEFV